MSLCAHFVRLYEFDHWANQRIISVMETLDVVPEKSLGRMSHIIRAQEFWMSRFAGAPAVDPNDLFPVWPLDEIKARIGSVTERLHGLIRSYEELDFDREVRFRTREGDEVVTQLYEILFHLITHGAHHRGQLASDLNPLLEKPMWLDMMAFFLEPRMARS